MLHPNRITRCIRQVNVIFGVGRCPYTIHVQTSPIIFLFQIKFTSLRPIFPSHYNHLKNSSHSIVLGRKFPHLFPTSMKHFHAQVCDYVYRIFQWNAKKKNSPNLFSCQYIIEYIIPNCKICL